VRDDRTGQAGFYRGEDVRGHASGAFGEQAMAQVEDYLAGAIERAFREDESAREAPEEAG
jgi:hypothetical protein